jgi:cutinase
VTLRPVRDVPRLVPALVLAATVALTAACAAPATSDAAAARRAAAERPIPGTTDRTCADLVVVGARGFTQDPDLNQGVGTEVRVTTARLVRLLQRRGDTSVHVEPIRYDSSRTATIGEYLGRTAQGSRMMRDRLEALSRQCPQSRFALVGFSQGAQVVHGVAADVPASQASRIALVAMIADPLSNPSDPLAHWAYGGPPTTGSGRLGPGPAVDPDLRDVAISLCVDGDEICHDRGAPGGPLSAKHKHFYETPAHAQETAEQLDAVLRRTGS